MGRELHAIQNEFLKDSLEVIRVTPPNSAPREPLYWVLVYGTGTIEIRQLQVISSSTKIVYCVL